VVKLKGRNPAVNYSGKKPLFIPRRKTDSQALTTHAQACAQVIQGAISSAENGRASLSVLLRHKKSPADSAGLACMFGEQEKMTLS
jgi:hypothetical protein